MKKIILAFTSIMLLCGLSFSSHAESDCPRIISQSPYITFQLEYLGLKECIVGASRYNKELNVSDTGGLFDPDAEVIASLEADLWITSNWTKQPIFDDIKSSSKNALRLESFESMAQIENNLNQIIESLDRPDLKPKAEAFSLAWREKAKAINAQGKKVLLISSCSKQPYSFGQNTWLADLFTHAGFEVVDKNNRVTFFPITDVTNELDKLINKTKPDLVFIFDKTKSDVCRLDRLPKGTHIVTLDGENFLQPSPTILEALDSLKINPLWQ